ncbi:hypothetical protein [Brachyspira sp. G79]|uniref:hypothetical protein n=1 Tax=Brachyspira sp. G79 TaxID=1358104 RepID=UPI000BBC80CA|nr:hypothetical protein [Brachyspira sp. G79]
MKQQTTNNKQQTTNNKQQTTNNKQQTTNNSIYSQVLLSKSLYICCKKYFNQSKYSRCILGVVYEK